MVRRVVLRGTAAAGLAAVVDSATPAGASARRCDRPEHLLPFAQELIFGYPGLPTRTVSVAQTDCDVAVVTADGQSGVLPLQVQSDLLFYTTITRTDRGPVTPDLIGLGPRAAEATARRHGFTLSFDAAVVDEQASFGAVVFQALPPGVPDSGPGTQVGVILAVGQAPHCSTRQLALSYLGGGPGAGNDFGTVLVRDASPRACALAGPLMVTGLDGQGRPVTPAIRSQVVGETVLSPRVGKVTRQARTGDLAGLQPGQMVGLLELVAEYRDGPARVDGGICAPLWVVPAAWRIGFADGHALTVRNADPKNPVKLVASGGFVTCRGQLGLAQPGYVGFP